MPVVLDSIALISSSYHRCHLSTAVFTEQRSNFTTDRRGVLSKTTYVYMFTLLRIQQNTSDLFRDEWSKERQDIYLYP